MLCLCSLSVLVCRGCPECVDNMPPRRQAADNRGAYRQLEDHVVPSPSSGSLRGVGHSIPLKYIFHTSDLMTRDLSWADVEVKKKFFLNHGGWGPSNLMLVRRMNHTERTELNIAFNQCTKVASEQDFNTTFLMSLSKLKARATTGMELYDAITSAYNVFEGNHRLAALCILAMTDSCEWCTWDFEVQCKLYEDSAANTLCRAVSAITNLAHYMARATTVIDALSYVNSVMVEMRRNRRPVNTAAQLIKELAAVGIHSQNTDEPQRGFDNEKTLGKLFEWIVIIGGDEAGVHTLEGLQRADGQRLHDKLIRTGELVIPKGRYGKHQLSVGGFLTWREIPCKKNKLLYTGMPAQELLWLVNRSWYHWISTGKPAKPSDWLLFKMPLPEDGKDAYEAAMKRDALAKEDMAFIDDMADNIEETKMADEDDLSVSRKSRINHLRIHQPASSGL